MAGEARVDDIDGWNRRLLSVRLDAGRDAAEAFRSFLETSRKVEAVTRARFEKGEATQTDVTKAQFDRIEAEDHTPAGLEAPAGPDPVPARGQGKSGGVPDREGRSPGQARRYLAQHPLRPAEASPSGGPAERLRIAEEAIAVLKKMLDTPNALSRTRASSARPQGTGLKQWETVADQARHELGGPDPGYLAALRDFEAKREAEAAARKRLDAGQGSRLDYLNAQLARVQAQQTARGQLGAGASRTPPTPTSPQTSSARAEAKPGPPDPGAGPQAIEGRRRFQGVGTMRRRPSPRAPGGSPSPAPPTPTATRRSSRPWSRPSP